MLPSLRFPVGPGKRVHRSSLITCSLFLLFMVVTVYSYKVITITLQLFHKVTANTELVNSEPLLLGEIQG